MNIHSKKDIRGPHFLGYVPANWGQFVAPAAQDTGVNVWTTDEDDWVAIWTHQRPRVDLELFWTRFRELKGD